MSLLFKDLIHDLREKRLWPVAAVLLLAIVAVPAVLLRSSSEDSAAAPVATPVTGANADAAVVALAGEGEVPASSLDSFDAKDPFEPSGSAAPAPPAQAEVPPAQDSLIPEGSDPSAPDSGGSPGSTGDGGGLPGVPGGTAPGSDDGDGDGKSKPTAYAYAVDVRFGRRDATIRTYRSLERLDVLPRGGDAPVLVFLGVSPTGKTAIFLVDSALDQHGDGRCKPSRDECTFLHLTTEAGHDLHYLENEEGDRYAIRLLDIRRERVETKKAKSSKKAQSSRKARAKAARARRENTELGADEFVYGE